MRANKGEWSEFYAFLKILIERELPAADKKLEVIPGKVFLFKKVFRSDKNGEKIYDISKTDIEIYDAISNTLLHKLTSKDLALKTATILSKIQTSEATTFEIPEANELMELTMCTQLKADNSTKADIVAIVLDRVSDSEEQLGFSVKSMIGGASTLLNAGQTTNFIYEVTGLHSGDISEINKIDGRTKLQDRLNAISEKGGKLTFSRMAKDTFAGNLRKIDTLFPTFIAEMLKDFFCGRSSKVKDLVKLLSENKELIDRYSLDVSDYEFKIKNFLIASALGMVPGKLWDGFTKAYGGYIVVKQNGQVVCYHLYNREEFLEYLYLNTKFESASSTRHHYGRLYEENGQIFINLNLQIRFIA